MGFALSTQGAPVIEGCTRKPVSGSQPAAAHAYGLQHFVLSRRKRSKRSSDVRDSAMIFRHSSVEEETEVPASAARMRAIRWVSSSTDTVMFLMDTT